VIRTVAIAAGTLLPYLAARDHRLLNPENEKSHHDEDSDDEDEDDKELQRIKSMVREWKAEAHREGRPLRLPISKSSVNPVHEAHANRSVLQTVPFLLRNIWTSALLLFGFLMFTTAFITKVWQVRSIAELRDDVMLTDRTPGNHYDCFCRNLLGCCVLGVSFESPPNQTSIFMPISSLVIIVHSRKL
jgi:hypothetical protein